MSTMPVALSLFAPSSDSMHPGKQQPRCQAVSSSQNRLQFARIDGQTDLDKESDPIRAGDNVCPNCSECTVERWFLTLNDLLTHEVGRRAKNRPFVLSKMIVISGGNLLPFSNPRSDRWEPKARVAFYISGTAF